MTRERCFGWLRLVFAAMVVVDHAPIILSGDWAHNPLAGATQKSLGSIAVDFFFIVSGYLVTSSYISAPSTLAFARNRFLRIYPAFFVMLLVLMFAVGPLGGGSFPDWDQGAIGKTLVDIALLQPPISPGAFAHLPGDGLDDPLWTLPFEFRCYVLAAILGAAGFFRRPVLLLILTTTLCAAWVGTLICGSPDSFVYGPIQASEAALLVNPDAMLRLSGVFLAGSCFRVFRDHVPLRFGTALVCLAGMLWLLRFPAFAEVGIELFGAYSLFYLASSAVCRRLFSWLEGADLSYGTYIYAWPIGMLLVTYLPGISAGALLALNLPAALIIAAISWYSVERPAIRLKGYSTQRSVPRHMPRSNISIVAVKNPS